MELDFINGNEVRQAACRTVAHNLLNLPFDSINLKHTIEFTPDPLPSSHNEFAVTNWTYDDAEPFTKIASVAPNWPEPWRGVKFLQESYAHELGHGFFAALPQAARLAIAAMFGVDSDDVLDLFPEGAAWEDKPGEGIAETFKDAFLPRPFRRYANRTNHTIPIHKYAEFRSLWRGAAPSVQGGGGGGAESLEVDLLAPLHTDLNNPSKVRTWESRQQGVTQDIRVATNFDYSMTVPRSLFPAKAEGREPNTVYGQIQFALKVTDAETEEEIHFARGAWLLLDIDLTEHDPLTWDDELFTFRSSFPEPSNVGEGEDNSEGSPNIWNLYAEEANDLGAPNFTLTHSFHVAAGRKIHVEALASFDSQSWAETVLGPLPTEIKEQIEDLLPHLFYIETAAPIALPNSEISAEGQSSGRRPKEKTIVGRNR